MLLEPGMDALNQALDDLVGSRAHTELTNGGPKVKCAMCGAKAPAGQSLLACAGCKITWYCGRECQVRAVDAPCVCCMWGGTKRKTTYQPGRLVRC